MRPLAPARSQARRRRRGAQVVEMALAFPVLVGLLTGVMDYGWFFSQQHNLVSAVREGARTGAATGLDGDPAYAAELAVRSALDQAGIDSASAEVRAEVEGSAPDLRIKVTAKIPCEPLVGMVPMPESLGASLLMRLEDQDEAEDTGR